MCFLKTPKSSAGAVAAPILAARTDDAAQRRGETEARLRRARAGAAADILTSPLGTTGAVTMLGAV